MWQENRQESIPDGRSSSIYELIAQKEEKDDWIEFLEIVYSI